MPVVKRLDTVRMFFWQRPLLRLATPTALVIVAVVIQWNFRSLIGTRAFLLLYPAVCFGSLVGGFLPGAIATTVAVASATFLFIPTILSFHILHTHDYYALAIFSLTGLFFSVVAEKIRRVELELREAVRSRDEFMSIASHELKTPLTSMKLQSQIRLRKAQKDPSVLDEKMKRTLLSELRQIDRVTRLIDDMLDISRIGSGKLTIKKQKCDLTELLRDLMQRYSTQSQPEESQFVFKNYPEPLVGLWDAFRIEQVIANVLNNALRYGKGKTIEVRLESENGSAVIKVRDQGIGISQAEQVRIFERFERGSSAEQAGGLGLGLYIARQIVEMHQGTIAVRSAVGEGSEFSIALPLVSHESERVRPLHSSNP